MFDVNHDAQKSHSRADRFFIWSLAFVIFVVPMRFGSFEFRNDLIIPLSIIVSLIYIFMKSRAFVFDDLLKFIFISSVIFSVLFVFSLLRNLNIYFDFKDLIETLKPLLFFIIFICGYSVSKSLDSDKLQNALIIAFILSVAFSLLVFIPQFHWLVDVYKGRTSYAEYNFHFTRLSGTFGFPGTFGYWLVLPCLLALVGFNQTRGINGNVKYAVTIVFLMLGLFLTGARGALALSVILSFLILFVSLNNKKVPLLILLFSFSVFVMFIILNAFADYSFAEHITNAIENPQGGTFGHRLRELEQARVAMMNNFWFGNGPSNRYLIENYGSVESGYFYYAYKFGFFGLAYLFLILILVSSIMVVLFKRRDLYSFEFVFSLWAFINIVVGSVSNSITDEYKSFFLFFALLGFCSFKVFKFNDK